MSDKMKSQFEAWYLDSVVEMYGEGVRVLAKSNLLWLRDDGSYADATLRFALMAWQSSRESLVVELPEGMTLNELRYGSKPKPDHERLLPRDACVKAIESLGLRVKP